MPETPDKSPIGPVGEQVVRNVEQLRKARKMSLRDLADRLDAVGVHIVPSVLHRLSQGKRRVDADDLIALSLALGVNPSALLLPRDAGVDDIIELAPNVRQRAALAWAWMDGRLPLPPELVASGTNVVVTPGDTFADFVRHARPDAARDPDPAIMELLTLRQMVEDVINDPDPVARWAQWRDTILRRFKVFSIQLEELAARLDRAAVAAEAFQFDTGGAAEQLRVARREVREPAIGFAPGTEDRYRQQAAQRGPVSPHAAPTTSSGPPPVVDPFGERGAR